MDEPTKTSTVESSKSSPAEEKPKYRVMTLDELEKHGRPMRMTIRGQEVFNSEEPGLNDEAGLVKRIDLALSGRRVLGSEAQISALAKEMDEDPET